MRWLLILSLLILLNGCIHRPEPVWTEIPTAQQLLDDVSAHSKRYTSLDATVNVSLTTGIKFFPSQQFIFLQKPDHLRTDVLSGFGLLLLQLASDGETLSVFLNTTVPGRFLRGPASYKNLYRFTKVPLAVEDLLALLLYGPPLIIHQERNIEVSARKLTLTLSGYNNSRQELLFDRQFKLIGCRYFTGNEKYLAVDYQNFSDKNQFPQKIIIMMPLENLRVKLELFELKVNTSIDPTRFSLKRHGNLPIEEFPE
jgi:outer membrane lipoprotein-sorting protein